MKKLFQEETIEKKKEFGEKIIARRNNWKEKEF